MTLRQLAELSALVALHGDRLIAGDAVAATQSLPRYLHHSRLRSRGWRQSFAELTADFAGDEPQSPGPILSLLTEIFVSEMLTRTWTAVLCASDERRGDVQAGPIAHHVLLSVLESRAEVLRHVVEGPPLPVGSLEQADAMRRKCDRWTDLLIGELAIHHDVTRFAGNPDRAREFCSHSAGTKHNQRQVTWALLAAGLRQAIPEDEFPAERASAHEGVVQSILSTLPDTPLQADGALIFPAVWRIACKSGAPNAVLPPSIAARLRSAPPRR